MTNISLNRKQILFGLLAILIFSIRYFWSVPPAIIPPDAFVGGSIEFQGVIVSEPDRRDDYTGYVLESKDKFDKYKIKITANRFPEYEYGNLVKVKGKIDFPKPFESDLGRIFDYPNYLAKDGIRYVSFRPEMMLVSKEHGSKFFTALYSFKDKFVENIEQTLTEPHSSLANGITLGLKQSLGKELLDIFRTAGIIHIVVLSGYNMTIILAGVMFFLGKFPKIPRSVSLGLGAILMLGFAALVGFSATVLRALLMATLAILARFLGRPVLAMRALFIAGGIMLLWNPLILFHDPSFQLSFLATFGLIAVSPIIQRRLNPDAWLAKVGAPTSALRSVLGEIFTATIATQIFVLPALIYMTGQFSIISLPVNLLILPLVPWTMAFTGIIGVIGFVSTLLAKIVAIPTYILLEFIIKISSIASHIPLASIKISTIPLWLVFVWYFIYLWLLHNFFQSRSN